MVEGGVKKDAFKLTRSDSNHFSSQSLEDVNFLDGNVVGHDNGGFVASESREEGRSLSAGARTRREEEEQRRTNFALAIVAIEIPVEPTVPSKIRDLV